MSKDCTNCSWWDDLTGYGVECCNPRVEHMMPDGTCPEWEEIQEDESVMVGQYIPTPWDAWKKKHTLKNLYTEQEK